MRKNQTSITAAGIAVMRAVESEKPEDERICFDPYARRFVPGWMFHFFGFFIKTGYAEWRGPGVNGFLAARDRYIDDVLQETLRNDLEQLVILGAGYDSRAYRFELAGRVKTFEVDHPATQQTKLAILRKVFGKTPEHVEFVPIDFNVQTLEEGLLETSYNPALKTLFIWQGVSMYLNPEAVDAVLHFVVKHSRPGSSIVFDYVYRGILEGAQIHREVKQMRRYRFMTGEGMYFGIQEGCIEDFLKERGFHQVKDVNSVELKKAYFTCKNASRKVAGGYGIAIGVV